MRQGFFNPGPTPLLLCLVILSTVPHLAESQSDTIVVWSQEAHHWTRMRGIYGDPRQWVPTLQVTFVGSIPTKDSRWTVIAHDPGTGFLFWVDAQDGSTIYRQFANDNLLQTSSPVRAQKILSRRDFKITGMAVDWNTGSVYFSETNSHFIGVTSTNDMNVDDVYRVVVSGGIDRPIGVAVMPVWRMVYWIDAGYRTIESCELDGANRQRFSSVHPQDVGDPLCLTLDHESQMLYWAARDGDQVVVKKLQLGQIDPIVETVFPLAGGINSIASFQNYIYTLNSTQYKLDIYVNDIRTMDPTREYIIDAEANDLTIVKPQQPTYSECSELDCSQICMNVNKFDGNYESQCLCGHAYTKGVDLRSCEKEGREGSTSYLYSHGNSVWLARASITYLPSYSIDLDEKPIQENYGDVRAVAGHVGRNLVFFADQANGVIYTSSAKGGDAQEITVNTRKVQGLGVDWLGDHIYWADESLELIMCSQLDGRYHRVILNSSDGIGSPASVAIDSARGKLFFISSDPRGNQLKTTGPDKPKLMMANLDGTELVTIADDLEEPSGLTVDPREYRLFWAERTKTMISSIKLDGTGRKGVFRGNSYEMFGTSVYQEIVTWTEKNSDQLKFGVLTSGNLISVNNSPNKAVSKTFDVKTFDFYAQPNVSNLCRKKNGGCQQLCFHTSNRMKPSLQRRRQCGCAIGFTLDEDGESCKSDRMEANFLMFVDPYHKQVYQISGFSDVTPREPQGIPLPYMEFPAAVEVNKKSGEFIWLDTRLNQIKAAKVMKDKKEEEVKTIWEIPNGYKIEKIAIDDKGEYIFYTDSLRGILGRMNMKGEDHVDLSTGLREPKALVYHQKGFLFWTEVGNPPRISMMKSDGTEYKVLYESGLYRPNAIAVPEKDENLIFWADERTITRMNITSQEVTRLHDIQSSYINAIATNGEDVYFSVWNEKGIFFINDTTTFTWQAKLVTNAIFARISHMTFMSTLPAGALSFPVVPVAAGVAAGFLFLLLLGLFLLLCFIRKPKKDKKAAAAAAGGEDSYFDDPDTTIQYANMPNDTLNNGHMGNGYTNGHVEPPANGILVPPTVLASEAVYTNTPPEGEVPEDTSDDPPGVPVMIPVVTTNLRRPKKPVELPAPKNDPTFELGQNEKVATRIQRLANRLRNRLSTVRWSGSPITGDLGELPPEVPDAIPYTKPIEKKTYDYKPALHNLPRGFAPASHTVPRPVKDTWGRNKHALAMKGEVPPH